MVYSRQGHAPKWRSEWSHGQKRHFPIEKYARCTPCTAGEATPQNAVLEGHMVKNAIFPLKSMCAVHDVQPRTFLIENYVCCTRRTPAIFCIYCLRGMEVAPPMVEMATVHFVYSRGLRCTFGTFGVYTPHYKNIAVVHGFWSACTPAQL